MAYATADDVIGRYKPLTTMIGPGTLDVTTVDIASLYIKDAESIVNGYLASKYSVPLTVEALVTDLTSDIAIYRLCSDKLPRMPDYMEKRYTNAVSMLEMIRDGKMFLTASSQTANSGGGGDQYAWSNVVDPEFQGTVFKPVETFSLGFRGPTNRYGDPSF